MKLPPAAAAHPAMQALVSAPALGGRIGGLPATLSDRAQPRPHRRAPRAASSRNHMPERSFRALMRSARREVLISNAYIIPDENFMERPGELAGRGVKVHILTNSLASHDVPRSMPTTKAGAAPSCSRAPRCTNCAPTRPSGPHWGPRRRAQRFVGLPQAMYRRESAFIGPRRRGGGAPAFTRARTGPGLLVDQFPASCRRPAATQVTGLRQRPPADPSLPSAAFDVAQQRPAPVTRCPLGQSERVPAESARARPSRAHMPCAVLQASRISSS